MINKYPQEEVFTVLHQIANKTDINKINRSIVVNDILPEYNGSLKNWHVGSFLHNVKYKKHNKEYHAFLESIGFKADDKRLIAKSIYICECIDKLYAMGIKMEEVPKKAMLSDYISDCTQDFNLGQILLNAKHGKVGKLIESKLKDYNFNFMPKYTVRRHQTCKMLEELAKVTDINNIGHKAVVKDFLPNYEGEMAEFNVGHFIQNVRSLNAYKEYHEFLKSIGFTFEKVKNRHTFEYICKAVDDLINAGVDINNIPERAMMSDYVAEYLNDDCCIGELFKNARLGRIGERLKTKLERVDFIFNKSIIKREIIIDILKQVAKVTDINSINSRQIVCDILPDYQGEMRNWPIGRFLATVRTKKSNKEYYSVLESLGFVWACKNKVHSQDYVFNAISNLVKIGVDLNSVPERAKMSDYIPHYVSDDISIGHVLSNARRGTSGKEIQEELKKYNFKFGSKTKVISANVKLNILQNLIENNIDINLIYPEKTLKDFVSVDAQNDYAVGKWLERARYGIGGDEFLDGLTKLGFRFEKIAKRNLKSIDKIK